MTQSEAPDRVHALPPARPWRPIAARVVAFVMLFGSAFGELAGLPGEWRAAVTTAQVVVVLAQVGMIVSGFAGGTAVALQQRWAVWAAIAWAASATLAGGLASRAFGGATWGVVATATIMTALMGLVVVKVTQVAVRDGARSAAPLVPPR